MSIDKEVIVHGATLADLPEIMRLLRIMHAEGGMFPLDEDLAREMFLRALKDTNKEGIIGVIHGENNDVRAMIYILITRMWYTQAFHLEELFNYVSPEHRRSNYADALIRFAQNARQRLGIPLLIGVLANNRMEEKVRLYRRRLGMPAGAFFVEGAEWVSERASDLDLWKVHQREHRTRGGRRVKSVQTSAGTTAISLSGA